MVLGVSSIQASEEDRGDHSGRESVDTLFVINNNDYHQGVELLTKRLPASEYDCPQIEFSANRTPRAAIPRTSRERSLKSAFHEMEEGSVV